MISLKKIIDVLCNQSYMYDKNRACHMAYPFNVLHNYSLRYKRTKSNQGEKTGERAYFVYVEPECHFDRIQNSNARENCAM